jgi:predicted ATP-dependent protease
MKQARHPLELQPEQLRRATDPATLGFETTRDLPAPPHMVGQSRAEEAITFSLEMRDSRYNLYVAGPPGTGRQTAVMVAVERVAKERPAPQDWCYVCNFAQLDEPRAVALPAGRARAFAHEVEALVLGARRELRRAFGADAYTRRRTDLLKDLTAQHRELLDGLRNEARRLGFLIESTPTGIAVVPLRPPEEGSTTPGYTGGFGGYGNGTSGATGGSAGGSRPSEPLSREEFDALPAAERERLEANRAQIKVALERALPRARAFEEEARSRVHKLNREVAEGVIQPTVNQVIANYTAAADAVEFLRGLGKDLLAHADLLRGDEGDPSDLASAAGDGESAEPLAADAEGEAGTAGMHATEGSGDDGDDGDHAIAGGLLRRYRVNVFVAHKADKADKADGRADDHAPIVLETNPTRSNLIGRIDAGQRGGLPYADHTMIKPGALHRANGGFLILQALDLLRAPHAWDVLKRTLRFETITIDTAGEAQGGSGGALLRPEPIPASVRIILIGDYHTYGLLLELDAEFRQLFKVRADFDVDMPRATEGERAYAAYTGNVARTTGGPPLTAEAVALIAEESSRWAEDQERLSALFGELRDLTMEACYWAKKERAATTTRVHVARAIIARERRLSLLADKLDEEIAQGTVAIATAGAVVGQVNGLSVLTTNDFSFGKPSRITARTSPGQLGIIDIEREVALSGASHTKGVLILEGFLRGRYAQEIPLSLTASLCFEQTHAEIEGDSASSTELFALLSSLAGVPIRQALAVTGAVNQRGEVQAVGGVTHKVEGFFRVCQARGLTGEQGVILPRANVRNLMLRDDVIEAVRAGRFHLYTIAAVDEGMELLTGMSSGQPDSKGRYPDNSLNGRVFERLRTFGERVRTYAPSPVPARR